MFMTGCVACDYQILEFDVLVDVLVCEADALLLQIKQVTALAHTITQPDCPRGIDGKEWSGGSRAALFASASLERARRRRRQALGQRVRRHYAD